MLGGLGVAWGGNVFVEIVQEQSSAHLKPRDLSSKYVQIADAINSLNSSKQPLPLAAVWPLFTCQNRLGTALAPLLSAVHPNPGPSCPAELPASPHFK